MGRLDRVRSITRAAENETASCGNNCCPSDCVMAIWGPWSPCSAKCGKGQRARTNKPLVVVRRALLKLFKHLTVYNSIALLTVKLMTYQVGVLAL